MDANTINLFRFVSREVHPADEMFRTAKLSMPETGKAFHYYFYSGGLLATRVADLLLEMGRRPARMSVLDFASGYGRVTRYFDLIFNRVTCSDLEPSMMQFCADNFSAEPQLSDAHADAVAHQSLHDLVFSFSLLTHIEPGIWADWFNVLARRMSPDGLLVFSTRSPEFARARGEAFDDGVGISFAPKNETDGRLDTNVYGQTTVSKVFVDAAAERAGLSRVRFWPGGEFDLYHDMHVFRR